MGAFNLQIQDCPHSRLITLATKVSSIELAAIEKKLEAVVGLSMSEFLRKSALSSTVNPAVIIPSINLEQWHDLARLGSNLNQIALQLHTKGVVNPYLSETIEQIRELLAVVRVALIQTGGTTNGL